MQLVIVPKFRRAPGCLFLSQRTSHSLLPERKVTDRCRAFSGLLLFGASLEPQFAYLKNGSKAAFTQTGSE